MSSVTYSKTSTVDVTTSMSTSDFVTSMTNHVASELNIDPSDVTVTVDPTTSTSTVTVSSSSYSTVSSADIVSSISSHSQTSVSSSSTSSVIATVVTSVDPSNVSDVTSAMSTAVSSVSSYSDMTASDPTAVVETFKPSTSPVFQGKVKHISSENVVTSDVDTSSTISTVSSIYSVPSSSGNLIMPPLSLTDTFLKANSINIKTWVYMNFEREI